MKTSKKTLKQVAKELGKQAVSNYLGGSQDSPLAGMDFGILASVYGTSVHRVREAVTDAYAAQLGAYYRSYGLKKA